MPLPIFYSPKMLCFNAILILSYAFCANQCQAISPTLENVIDPKHVAATSASSEVCTSLKLGLYTDVAVPNSDAPVAQKPPSFSFLAIHNVHGTLDPTLSANFGVAMQKKLSELGVPCELDYPGADDAQHPTFDELQVASLSPRMETLNLWSDEQLGTASHDDTEIRRERREGDDWIGNITRPTLSVYHPKAARSCGTAMVICPGGGYGGLAIEKEGYRVAQWLSENGITAGVLKYRCGGEAYQYPVPLDDAGRAIEIFRYNAKRWNLAPNQIGVMGFSAGGHLASLIATDRKYQVNFAALIYPVISLQEPIAHAGCKKNLIGQTPSASLVQLLSSEHRVSSSSCPVFLVHAGDDQAVPVENSIRFYQACIRNGVPAEMHLFPIGGHGFGMYRGGRAIDHWPVQFKAWLISNGWCRSN